MLIKKVDFCRGDEFRDTAMKFGSFFDDIYIQFAGCLFRSLKRVAEKIERSI